MLRLLSLKQILKNLPTGRGWFSKLALSPGGSAYKFFDSVAKVISDFKLQLNNNRGDLFLLEATGSGLDFWGQDLALPRRDNESDDSYRDRLFYLINETKLSVTGIQASIFRETGITVDVFLPWEYLDIKSYSKQNNFRVSSRSGQARRPDNFWTSGTIQIIAPSYDSRIAPIVERLKAAHIKVYIKYKNDTVIDDDLQPEGGVSLAYFKEIDEFQGFIANDSPEDIYFPQDSDYFSLFSQKSHLFDDPYINTAIWQTSQTWKSIHDSTWLTAIDVGYDSLSDQVKLYKQTGQILSSDEFWTDSGQFWSDYYVWKDNQPAQIIEVPYWYVQQYETLTVDNFTWSPQ